MSQKNVSPALHIARRHQSAPKATELDVAVRKAAEEIDGGRWIEDPRANPEKELDGMGLTQPTGRLDDVVRRMGPHDGFAAEVQQGRALSQLGRHPRVQEAIEKLESETEDGKTPDQVMENRWRMWEMTRDQVSKNQWDGQERWMGRENEEMRHGEVMTPAAFYERLVEVTGPGRLIRGTRPDMQNPGDRSGRIGLYVPNPEWEGAATRVYKNVEARKVRDAGKDHMLLAQKLRKAGHNAEADREFDMAGEAFEAAGGMLVGIAADDRFKPELLRVATLQYPAMTEFMVMHFDEYGVPTEAKFIGWRTALLTMIRCNAITEEEAHMAFPVGTGEAAVWYLEQLYRMRSPTALVN
jgi:hypothetical protein